MESTEASTIRGTGTTSTFPDGRRWTTPARWRRL